MHSCFLRIIVTTSKTFTVTSDLTSLNSPSAVERLTDWHSKICWFQRKLRQKKFLTDTIKLCLYARHVFLINTLHAIPESIHIQKHISGSESFSKNTTANFNRKPRLYYYYYYYYYYCSHTFKFQVTL
jgi:hypothetical protein